MCAQIDHRAVGMAERTRNEDRIVRSARILQQHESGPGIRMHAAAKKLDFERAAEYRDRLRYLQTRALLT